MMYGKLQTTCFARAAAVAATALTLTITLLGKPAAADPPPWEPMTPPAEVEGPVQILIVAIDGSGSMLEGRTLSPRAKAAGRHAVAEVERCTYVVIALFGSEARVVTDRFACSPHDRQVLLDAIENVPMNASRTDVRVLEGLLTQIRHAVTERYATRGFRMEVQILTDGEPDPVDRTDRQTFDVIVEQHTTRAELGGSLLLLGLEFGHAAPRRGTAFAAIHPAPAVRDQTPATEPAPAPGGSAAGSGQRADIPESGSGAPPRVTREPAAVSANAERRILDEDNVDCVVGGLRGSLRPSPDAGCV